MRDLAQGAALELPDVAQDVADLVAEEGHAALLDVGGGRAGTGLVIDPARDSVGMDGMSHHVYRLLLDFS
ncbi:conserved hypothetical protein [Micrococcus luteus]|nr:Uncharacterised protein [Streptococcus pneumoniae]VXB00250.1 conserved hypothetical protein [Micrococcus luteus]